MTAHSVVDIISSIVEGREQVFALQVNLKREWLDIDGVCGVPVILGQKGWSNVFEIDLNSYETKLLKRSAEEIKVVNKKYL